MKEQKTVYVLKEPETGWYFKDLGEPFARSIHEAWKFERQRSAELVSRRITRAKTEVVKVRVTYEEVAEKCSMSAKARGQTTGI